jgi:hypothetical protein
MVSYHGCPTHHHLPFETAMHTTGRHHSRQEEFGSENGYLVAYPAILSRLIREPCKQIAVVLQQSNAHWETEEIFMTLLN